MTSAANTDPSAELVACKLQFDLCEFYLSCDVNTDYFRINFGQHSHLFYAKLADGNIGNNGLQLCCLGSTATDRMMELLKRILA